MKNLKILAIHNCEIEGFGFYEKYFLGKGMDYNILHAYRDDNFPESGKYDLIIIGGTPIPVYNISEHAFLQKESDYLQSAIAHDKPCLGICGGAQLLAQVLGARVTRNQPSEIGGYQVHLTVEGQNDPLLRGFPDHFPVFQWHGDTFDIPSGGELLVTGDDCRNQFFRKDNIVGIQFHLEISCKEAAVWADAYMEELNKFGKSKNQLLEECGQTENEREQLANLLLDNYISILSNPA